MDAPERAGRQTVGRIEEIATRTSRVWLDDDRIIRDVAHPGSEHDADDARATISAYTRVARGERRPVLVDISHVRSVTREARAVYAGEGTRNVSAVALVVSCPLSRMVGNFFLGFNRPPVPTRLFSSTEDAAHWLRELFRERDGGDRP